MDSSILDRLRYWKLMVHNRLPEFIVYRRDLYSLPKKWLERRNEGIMPEDWERGGFLCLCSDHVDDFVQEQDVKTDVMGYYICDRYNCGRLASHEVMPNLNNALEKFKESVAVPEEEAKEMISESDGEESG